MAGLNPNTPSPSKRPNSIEQSSSKHPATASISATQPSSFEKFLSKVKTVDPASRPAQSPLPASTLKSSDFSAFSINKSVQSATISLTGQSASGAALRDKAGTVHEKRAVGYSAWDIPAPGLNAPVQKVAEVSLRARHTRMRSCEFMDEELGGHTQTAKERLPDTGILANNNAETSPFGINDSTTLNTTASSPSQDRQSHATHLTKVYDALEIHSVLLTRLNALPVCLPFGITSLHISNPDKVVLNTEESKILHQHLSRCEQNLHSLVREKDCNEKSTAVREACVDVLELVAGRVLGAANGEFEGEDDREKKKNQEGKGKEGGDGEMGYV